MHKFKPNIEDIFTNGLSFNVQTSLTWHFKVEEHNVENLLSNFTQKYTAFIIVLCLVFRKGEVFLYFKTQMCPFIFFLKSTLL